MWGKLLLCTKKAWKQILTLIYLICPHSSEAYLFRHISNDQTKSIKEKQHKDFITIDNIAEFGNKLEEF